MCDMLQRLPIILMNTQLVVLEVLVRSNHKDDLWHKSPIPRAWTTDAADVSQ